MLALERAPSELGRAPGGGVAVDAMRCTCDPNFRDRFRETRAKPEPRCCRVEPVRGSCARLFKGLGHCITGFGRRCRETLKTGLKPPFDNQASYNHCGAHEPVYNQARYNHCVCTLPRAQNRTPVQVLGEINSLHVKTTSHTHSV